MVNNAVWCWIVAVWDKKYTTKTLHSNTLTILNKTLTPNGNTPSQSSLGGINHRELIEKDWKLSSPQANTTQNSALLHFEINLLRSDDAYIRQYTRPSLVQMMACRMISVKPWYEPVLTYRKNSSISRTLVCNIIVDNSDVVGASPVGAAPTTSSFST